VDREAISKAVREAGPRWWLDSDIAHIVDNIMDVDLGTDAESVAHDLWALGAGGGHPGCRYADGGSDADYENDCDVCKTALVAKAGEILASGAGMPEPTNSRVCTKCGVAGHLIQHDEGCTPKPTGSGS
jgi:hypothetical protein